MTFRVKGHPQLGEFEHEEQAAAAAWTMTKPGATRPEVWTGEAVPDATDEAKVLTLVEDYESQTQVLLTILGALTDVLERSVMQKVSGDPEVQRLLTSMNSSIQRTVRHVSEQVAEYADMLTIEPEPEERSA